MRRYRRRGGVDCLTTTIQGKTMSLLVAKMQYVCIHCLHPLKRRDFGLVCCENTNHYGFITKTEAEKLTQEERFMNIGDMFPSDYLRGIDVSRPMRLTIKSVSQEMARNNSTNKVEPEYVMYFKETPKKLRLNVTMAKEVCKFLDEAETDRWKNKPVTVYRTTIKAFGTEHVVPRIREVQSGDKPPTTDEPEYTSLDDLLYALYENYGIPETVAKKALKDGGHKSFAKSRSGEMYRDVELLLLNGELELPDETPIDDETEQPALIETEAQGQDHYQED
jgi:hypothetical protein